MDLHSIFSMLYYVKIYYTQNGALQISLQRVYKQPCFLYYIKKKRHPLPFYQNWGGLVVVLFLFFKVHSVVKLSQVTVQALASYTLWHLLWKVWLGLNKSKFWFSQDLLIYITSPENCYLNSAYCSEKTVFLQTTPIHLTEALAPYLKDKDVWNFNYPTNNCSISFQPKQLF